MLIFGSCNGDTKEAEELFYKTMKLYFCYATPIYFTLFPLFIGIYDYRITLKNRLKKLKLHLRDRKTIGLLNPLYPKKFLYTYIYKDIPFTIELKYKDKYVDLDYFAWQEREHSYASFSYYIKSVIHFYDRDITLDDYSDMATLGIYKDCNTLDDMAFRITKNAMTNAKQNIADLLLEIQDSPKLVAKKVFLDKA